MDIIVGTFNTPTLHTLRFTSPTRTAPASLTILGIHPAIGSHSWLALDPSRTHLYCTAWTKPPSVVAYRISPPRSHSDAAVPQLTFINSAPVASRSGYTAVHPSGRFLYSVGGPSGEVFALRDDGGIGTLVQTLSFVEDEATNGDGQQRPHGDFGGLRHGSHSVDVSPDGRSVYVADIGRNCVWTYSVVPDTAGTSKKARHLAFGGKHIAPRATDGPRHTTPHPDGRVLYSLQEHSSMIDAFSVRADGVTLTHLSGVKIIPADKDPANYWADEVRVSTRYGPHGKPRFLYASTRGLKPETKGFVAVVELAEDGGLGDMVDLWETPTSGGWANAVEPAPARVYEDTGEGTEDVEWLALTDSEEGWVFVLGFDGAKVVELARVKLEDGEGRTEVVGAATAVWL